MPASDLCDIEDEVREDCAITLAEPTSPPHGWNKRLAWPPQYAVCGRWNNRIAPESPISPDKDNAALLKFISDHQLNDRFAIAPLEWQIYQIYKNKTFVPWDFPGWTGSNWWHQGSLSQMSVMLVRRSKTNPNMVSYFDNDKGYRGIRTRSKPGRFLKKYWGGVLNDNQIAYFTEWFLSGTRPKSIFEKGQMEIARTREDIKHVYMNGPSSCMSHPRFSECYVEKDGSYIHPTEAYATPDLGIAYIRHEDRVIARALVRIGSNGEKSYYGRVYPNADSEANVEKREALINKLRAAGFESGESERDAFEGARLLKIPARRSQYYAMPYLDHHYCWKLHPDHPEDFCMTRSSGAAGTSTSGSVHFRGVPVGTCHYCTHSIYSDETSGFLCDNTDQPHIACESCMSHSFVCFGSKLRYNVSVQNETCVSDNNVYSVKWMRANGFWQTRPLRWWCKPDDKMMIVEGMQKEPTEVPESWVKKNMFTCQITGKLLPNMDMHPHLPNVWKFANSVKLAEYAASLKKNRKDTANV